MSQSIKLNEIQVNTIQKLAQKKRLELGFTGEMPIANDIFTILDSLNIMLLEYPIESDGDKPAFSAALIYSEEGGRELTFIGLNTAIYYDKQIFAVGHELYHYYTKKGSHFSRLDDEEKSTTEAEASRFAVEFLLPEHTMKHLISDEFKKFSLEGIKTKTLLRFVARLHCTWWLPYRSLVKRLKEISAISDKQFEELNVINERDMGGEYARIGFATNKDTFAKLNTATKTVGTSPKHLEVIIRNFEDKIIDEDKFADTLLLFGKNPEDYGYGIKVSQEDIDEIDEFLRGEAGE
jgi:Zn-dependent peptidase ImmA (M78 family)